MAVENATELLEEATDVIEDTLDLMEKKASWLSNPKTFGMAAGLLGVALGSAATYLIVSKRLSAKYQRQADEQVADVKTHYEMKHKEGKFSDPVSLAEDRVGKVVTNIIDKEGYASVDEGASSPIVPDKPDLEIIEKNVFTDAEVEDEWDYEHELRNRTETDPYILHKEEFMANEKDYEQATLTYFEEDEVLADSQDKPVPDSDNIVGDHNLLRFGYGSGDKNIVYIRNDILEMEFEIVHSEGSYSREVLGFIQHSADGHRKVPKFRHRDE